MFDLLEFVLSPIADKNTPTGAILDSVARSRASRRHRNDTIAQLDRDNRELEQQLTRIREDKALRLKEREVAALEKIADKTP